VGNSKDVCTKVPQLIPLGGSKVLICDSPGRQENQITQDEVLFSLIDGLGDLPTTAGISTIGNKLYRRPDLVVIVVPREILAMISWQQ